MIAQENLQQSLGSYSFKEAALYIRATLKRKPVFPRLTTQHLHWWVREGLVDDETTEDAAASGFVNFLELISFRMIAMLRTYGISSKSIQLAHNRLQERWGWDYPFAMEPVWVASPDIFVEINKIPVAPTKDWQAALDMIREFWEPVEVGFHGLNFDKHLQAVSWVPSSGVILNPKVQFGEPCIQDTRVPTETIWAFYQAGDSVDTLAHMYGLPASKLQDAINWEEKIAKAAEDDRGSNFSAG
jgi:uncharacterized protein (DUF433 family)